jgi:pseudaminic acid synthase
MSSQEIIIAGRRIGNGQPPYIIAELSGNHNGKIERALVLMEMAKKRGADAVKLQTYTADTMTIDHKGPGFQIEGGLWGGRSLYELYQEAQTPWAWHADLFAKGRDIGITVFSTPFDRSAVDFLEKLDAPAYKIASFELIDRGLIEYVAATGKPMVMSTGMASLGEMEEAIAWARGAGCKELALLHCVSGYPTAPGDANLRTIAHLRSMFGASTGLSDHTLGVGVSVAAVALGAALIEKHVTLARADGGPDAAFSLEPDELEDLVKNCRLAWEALGSVSYQTAPSEAPSLVFRRSLYAVADIKEGETIDERNVRCIRPGFGLPPKFLPELLGKTAARAIPRGTPLAWGDIRLNAPSAGISRRG